MKIHRLVTASWLVAVLAGCGLGNVPPAPQMLDLGPPPTSVTTETGSLRPLNVPAMTAVGTLQTPKVIWRIGHDGQPNAYATVRWTSPPAVMVHERLNERLSRQSPVLSEWVNPQMTLVRSSLLQFEQIFDVDGNSSEGVVTLQVVLVAHSQVLDQYRVTRRVKARDNTAEGGAQALRKATDEAVNDVAQWVATVTRTSR